MRFRTLRDGVLTETQAAPHFSERAEVCVVGLGTAGALAAISAAEGGVSVLGVERTAHLGGAGGGACVWDYFFGTPGGRFEAVNDECYRRIAGKQYASAGGKIIRDEALPGLVKSAVLTEQALAAGCRLRLGCEVTGVYIEGETVVGLQVFDGAALRDLGCAVLIDGADGFVCRLAGCEFLPGRPSDNHTMQFSHMFGEWVDGFVRGTWSLCGFPEAASAQEWSERILKSYASPACLRARYSHRVLFEAAILGIREVYNVRTDTVYTFAELAAGKAAEQPLFYGFSPMDNTNSDNENESEPMQDWKILAGMHRFGLSIGMPMGALIPAGKDGLLVVGKATGLGHDLSAGLRMKSDMEKCGEAAGRWAALARHAGVSLRAVSYETLRGQLTASGCFNEAHQLGLADLNEPDGKLWKTVRLPTTLEEFHAALASEEPGPALWAARNQGTQELRAALASWQDVARLSRPPGTACSSPTSCEDAGHRWLAENSAIALALTGDRASLTMLRDIVRCAPVCRLSRVKVLKTRYRWLETTCVCNFTKALCLLGRFRDAESLPVMRSIVADQGTGVAARTILVDGGPTREQLAAEFAAYARSALRALAAQGER